MFTVAERFMKPNDVNVVDWPAKSLDFKIIGKF